MNDEMEERCVINEARVPQHASFIIHHSAFIISSAGRRYPSVGAGITCCRRLAAII
jgi:hypothetical protein